MPMETVIIKLINSRIIIRHSNVIRTDNINVLNPLYKISQVRYLTVQTGVFRIVLTAFNTVFFPLREMARGKCQFHSLT